MTFGVRTFLYILIARKLKQKNCSQARGVVRQKHSAWARGRAELWIRGQGRKQSAEVYRNGSLNLNAGKEKWRPRCSFQCYETSFQVLWVQQNKNTCKLIDLGVRLNAIAFGVSFFRGGILEFETYRSWRAFWHICYRRLDFLMVEFRRNTIDLGVLFAAITIGVSKFGCSNFDGK